MAFLFILSPENPNVQRDNKHFAVELSELQCGPTVNAELVTYSIRGSPDKH